MGHEVIKNLLATPQRMYAALSLLQQLGTCPRRELLELLQPRATSTKQLYSEVVSSLVFYKLAEEDNSQQRILAPTPEGHSISSLEMFRLHMQTTLLHATREEDDNFLLGLFTAWYAVQDAQILVWNKADYERKFHQELFEGIAERPLSQNPDLNAWQLWAEFLGWGWTLEVSARQIAGVEPIDTRGRSVSERRIIPDATLRVRPLLPQLLPERGTVQFDQFIRNLSEHCPELDEGVLFQRAWNGCHGDAPRGNRISLMLSTALRVLVRSGELVLIDQADATSQWTLFPAQSDNPRVTHISRKVEA